MGQIEQGVYRTSVQMRHARGNRMRLFYGASLIFALLALLALLYNITNQAFGLVAQEFEIKPNEAAAVINGEGAVYEDLTADDFVSLLVEFAPRRMLVLVRDTLRDVPENEFTRAPLSEAIDGEVPEEWQELTITDLETEQQAELLRLNLSREVLDELVVEEVLQIQVRDSWLLVESIFNRTMIENEVEENYPEAEIVWRSWVSLEFITSSLRQVPAETGILPSLLGSIWIMLIVGVVSFPLGVGAAIYLEEYANDAWYNRIIETNIRNLAGVPSIIYGLLGLAIFVRVLEGITNGRTILSAGLTLALLILPIIIISSQEALKAVPNTIREASYGLGATRWQTISRQVLPNAIPGIMTGTILALSRAVGETAPLVVVGAAAFISVNPDGPLSAFSAVPILIYNWVSQPDPQYQNAAAAAIIVLLALLLTMNSVAIFIRNRAQKARG